MATLSITTAWNETVELVRREAGLLFPISFLLIALPSALMEATAPQPAAPGQAAVGGLWVLLVVIASIAGLIGNVAIASLALRSGVSVGEALRRGLSRLPSVLAVAILLFVAFIVLFFIVAVIAVLLMPGALAAAESGATATPAVIAAILIALLIILPVAVYFAARLTLVTPIAAAEAGNPFELIGRSWRLTAGHIWKLVGFLLLVGVVIVVLTGAIRAVAGILFALAAGPLEPGSTSLWLVTVVMALVNMVVYAYLTSLIARIYVQLAGDVGHHRVFE